MNKYCLILWTCKNIEEARQITSFLLEKKLIACANFFSHVESMFHWDGKINSETEVQVSFKTKSDCFEKVKNCILEKCSYEVPEILQIPIQSGHLPYLLWIENCVK